MKVYGTFICPDCPPVKKLLDEKKVDYVFMNITEDIAVLKEFLKLREDRDEFREIRKEGYVGIPCMLQDDGEILFYDEIFEKYDK